MSDREEGSGTVLMLALVAVALVLAAAAGTLGRARVVRAEAQTAADLGALAGASVVALPPGVVATAEAIERAAPCAVVDAVVGANGGRLVMCRAGSDGVVTVGVVVVAGTGSPGVTAHADARAGPASAR